MRAAILSWPDRPIRNLANNPSFETAGATVEIWRNLSQDPGAATTAFPLDGQTDYWAGTGGAATVTRSAVSAWPKSGRVTKIEQTTLATDQSRIQIARVKSRVTAAGLWTFVAKAKLPSGRSPGPSGTTGFGAGNTGTTLNTTVSLGGDIWEYRLTANVTDYAVFSAQANPRIDLSVGSTSVPVGAIIEMSEIDIYPGAFNQSRGWFSGSYSSDPDLTSSWTGTANGSESVLQGTRPVGVASGNPAVRDAVQSTKWSKSGTKSTRIIARTASSQAGVTAYQFNASAVGKTFTAVTTCRLDQIIGAGQDTPSRSLYLILNPATQMLSTAPNEPGVYELRGTFTVVNASAELRLGGGGNPGEGDVWWDDLLIVEGVYNGPYRDGDSPGWSWAGAVGASTSAGPAGR